MCPAHRIRSSTRAGFVVSARNDDVIQLSPLLELCSLITRGSFRSPRNFLFADVGASDSGAPAPAQSCLYLSMYLCIYVSMYLCVYVSMYLCIYVSMCLCVYVSMYLCIYVSMYLCIYVSMYLCIYVSMYLSLYIYIYIYIHFSLPQGDVQCERRIIKEHVQKERMLAVEKRSAGQGASSRLLPSSRK